MSATILLMLLSVTTLAAADVAPPIRVLIVDGFSNHDWRLTTTLIRGIIEPTRLFEVSVSTSPPTEDAPGWDQWRPKLSDYDVVIQNCNDISGGPSWPPEVQRALEKFVSQGGGLYVWHSANNAFANWPAYNEMIGLGWRKKDFGWAISVDESGSLVRIPAGEGGGTGHGSRLDTVVKRLGEHPIHAGLPREWKTPDIEVYYYARGPAENIEVLSYGYDPRTRMNWPLEWTVAHGEGRVYTSTFGHVWTGDTQPERMRCAGVQTLVIRALQWLARREVTWPMPADFPTAGAVSIRGEIKAATPAAAASQDVAARPRRGSGGPGRPIAPKPDDKPASPDPSAGSDGKLVGIAHGQLEMLDEAIPAIESRTQEYAIGADLSFLRQAEARGTVFKDGGEAKPGLQIFRDHGYNWIRLRLFHTPTRLPNDLEYTLACARDAKERGFKFLLNYHYSDTWADPAHQVIPAAWQGKSHAELVEAVFDYTRDTITAFREAGVLPDMVQVGNEITPGMLWPDGKLPDNWDQFADLLKAGIRGVHAGSGANPAPRIMIHIDKGGNQAATRWFFDRLHTYEVEYDVIGQSFYPWWHGSLPDLRDNLAFMATAYDKDIMLVEVAYCWRPTEYRDRPGPFPETPEGQREFLAEVNRLVLNAPNHRGIGIFWWEPAVTGRLRNRGFFDDDGNALPVIEVFDQFTRH